MSVSAVLELYIFLCIRLLPNRERKNRCKLQGQEKKKRLTCELQEPEQSQICS